MGIENFEVKYGKNGEWNGTDGDVLVNGLPFWEYLESRKDSNQLLKNYIVLITQIFYHRVKCFIEYIVMANGPDEPNFKYYSYRVEFQARGLPHIHGVLWFDIDWLTKKGLKPDLHCEKDNERQKLVELIDTIMSCKIPEECDDDEETMQRDFVLASQEHRHTRTCYKNKKVECRFHFPKLPSEKTVMAIPLKEKFPNLSPKEKEEKSKKYKRILSNAKNLLSDKELDINMSFDKFYENIKCSKEDYDEAISTTETGKVIILERRVREIWVNTYNPNWLKCWNANMDIQIAHDPYAVMTYITEYVGKDESGMTKTLQDVLRRTKHLNKHQQMIELKKAYEKSRQIGASETVFRLMPHLHLANSNIGCTPFITTGYLENRHHFFTKVSEENSELDVQHDNITLADRSGKYRQSISIHENS